MSFGIRPLKDKVVIEKVKAETTTKSGIVLTGQAKEKPNTAKVLAVGEGTTEEPMELKVGDVVIFSEYAGTDVKYEGEEYTIISQSNVLAVIDN